MEPRSDRGVVEVLIVGGGTVGLSTALFLAHQGIAAQVVERQDGPSLHPRATGVSLRTLELFREVGLEDAVNAVAIDMARNTLGKITVDTLATADLSALAAARPSHARAAAHL